MLRRYERGLFSFRACKSCVNFVSFCFHVKLIKLTRLKFTLNYLLFKKSHNFYTVFRIIDRVIEKLKRLGSCTFVNQWLPTVSFRFAEMDLVRRNVSKISFIALDRRTKDRLIVESLNRINRMLSTFLSASIICFIFERVSLSKFSEGKEIRKAN